MAIISNTDTGRGSTPPPQSGATWQAERVTPFLRERSGGALALKRVAPPAEADAPEAASLPLLATASDVREVVRLLKRKAGGVTIIEGMDASRRVFDARKVAAYEYWGLVKRSGDRLSLSALGWEFARRLEPEAQLYRTMLNATPAYRAALEWAFGQQLEIVTDADVAAHWLEHPAEVKLAANQKTIEGNVACFFHLCQEAELGLATVGKRGQPTRLRVDREELAAYIANRPSPAPDDLTSQPAHEEVADEHQALEHSSLERPASERPASERQAMAFAAPLSSQPTPQSAPARLRVFISHGSDGELLEQLRATLEVAEIESELSRRASVDDDDAQLVSDELCRAMRRCDAALIVVNRDDCRADAVGNAVLHESLLMEIAAAVVYYNRRVILLWDESLAPSNCLSRLCRCEFAGDGLTWDSGMRLLKALKNFKP
ncbi:MAG: hypothetical protein QOF02_3502 [Blastocatellia bacterium]|jgi:hypothetical protein|nr:hypothetical protein [Blastocatellia bacterium]